MRRRLAHLAPVVGSAHQSFSKMALPDAIHHDTRCQRMVGTGEPLRQLQTATAFGHRLLRLTRQYHGELLGYRLTRAVVIAVKEHSLFDAGTLAYRARHR